MSKIDYHSPDLTLHPPRSPRVKLGGYVTLPRIIDKARASIAGKLGEYHYGGKGRDRHFFAFTGLDHEGLKAEAAKGLGDGEILAWVQANTKRQKWEIAQWSDYQARMAPDSDAETLAFFAEKVGALSKTREDINTWFDLIELDDYCSFGGKA
jgi:hypothetical protein